MNRDFLAHFTFDNSSCVCEIEKMLNDKSFEMENQLAITCVETPKIKMAYVFGDGLKVVGDRANTQKNNVLGEFLGIKKEDLQSYKSFFEKYGFLFNITKSSIARFKTRDIEYLQSSLQAFVLLLNNQKRHSINVQELLDACLFLLTREDKEIKIGNNSLSIKSLSFYQDILRTPYQQEDTFNKTTQEIGGQLLEVRLVYDYVMNQEIPIELESYREMKSDDHYIGCRGILNAYFNKENIFHDNEFAWLLEDFLFQFITRYAVFHASDVRLDGTFEEELYNDFSSDEPMMKALMEISQKLLIHEFDIMLSDVKPTYNVEELKPDWKLPSLHSAMYFSLFYLDEKNYDLRRCANPNCNQYFQVSKTNSRKKYCCIECTNATGQRAYQGRKRGQG